MKGQNTLMTSRQADTTCTQMKHLGIMMVVAAVVTDGLYNWIQRRIYLPLRKKTRATRTVQINPKIRGVERNDGIEDIVVILSDYFQCLADASTKSQKKILREKYLKK